MLYVEGPFTDFCNKQTTLFYNSTVLGM